MSVPLKIYFIGTGAAVPSRHRGFPALAIKNQGTLLLCDCGEGTQLKLVQMGLSAAKINAIFISHLHGDHIFGLPGFLSTQKLLARLQPLTIYGPTGLKAFLEMFSRDYLKEPGFALTVRELATDREHLFSISNLTIEAKPLEHGKPCFGYRIEQTAGKGKFDVKKAEQLHIPNGPERSRLIAGESIVIDGKTIRPRQLVGPAQPGIAVAYCTDTRPCRNSISLARNCHLLIHDSTFTQQHSDRAKETGHSTAVEAAGVARQAGVKKLALWHISQRIDQDSSEILLSEALSTFSASFCPQDHSHIVIDHE